MSQPSRFFALLSDRNAGIVRTTSLQLRPLSWSDTEIGGPERATVAVDEPQQRLFEVLDWLGLDIEIYNAAGSLVWWGFVNEIELQLSGLQLQCSLDNLANQIAVAYTYTDGAGASQRATTAYAADAASVAQYGSKELLMSLAEGDSTVAESLRTQALAAKAKPAVAVQPARGAADGVRLYCRGHWDKLAWRYYAQAAGREVFEENADQECALAAEYSTNTIDFTAVDNIYDTANLLGWMQAGADITVSGSAQAANNTTWEVQDVTSGHVNVEPNAIVTSSDSPARTITISRGRARTTKIAQSFQRSSSAGWYVYSIAVQLKRYGEPTDSIKLELCSDSGGAPGTVLESSLVAMATLSAETLGWVEFSFGGTILLAASTTYWLVFSRTGSADAWQYCSVGWATAAGYAAGQVKTYTGSAWETPSPAVDVPFKIFGKRQTTDQIGDIVTATDAFTGVDLLASSGRYTLQYRAGDRRGSDEITELLRPGTSSNERLVVTVTRERRVVVTTAMLASGVQFLYRRDGQLYSRLGRGRLEPGRLIAGEYLELDLPAHVAGAVTELSPVYVIASEYDAENEQLTWTSANAADLFDFGVQEG